MAMKEILTGHVASVENPADICTKVFPGRAKRKLFIGKVLHDLYEQQCVGKCSSIQICGWTYMDVYFLGD